MKKFIDRVIDEVEDAGIDDEHAADEPKKPTSTRVIDSAVFVRTHR